MDDFETRIRTYASGKGERTKSQKQMANEERDRKTHRQRPRTAPARGPA